MIARIVATLVSEVNTGLLENDPNTYPMISTIQAANNTRDKMIIGNMILVFRRFKSYSCRDYELWIMDFKVIWIVWTYIAFNRTSIIHNP